MIRHSFGVKKKEGEVYAAEQDAIYKQWYQIRPASEADDLRGIDRYFSAKDCRLEFTMQYKGDDRATQSKKLFIEIVSVDTDGSPGWALKCAADYLSIYVPQDKTLYLFQVRMLRVWVPAYLMQGAVKPSLNFGYSTLGICVPRDKIEASAPCMLVHKHGCVTGGQDTMAWAKT